MIWLRYLPSDRSDRDTPSKASDCDTAASSSTIPETQSGKEIIKLFSCSTQLSMKLQLFVKVCEYDQEMSPPQVTDQPMAPWLRGIRTQTKKHTHTHISKNLIKVKQPGPEVIKLFSCSTQLSTKFQLLIKITIQTSKDVSCFKSIRCCTYHVYKL